MGPPPKKINQKTPQTLWYKISNIFKISHSTHIIYKLQNYWLHVPMKCTKLCKNEKSCLNSTHSQTL